MSLLGLRMPWLGLVLFGALSGQAWTQAPTDQIPVKPEDKKTNSASVHDAFTIGGVPQHPGRAIEDCRIAAENGDAGAMVRLGEYCEKGTLTETNIPQAVEWYKKALGAASPHGNAPALLAAEFALVRLSRAGLTKEKYGHIATEDGGGFWVLDDKTPTKQLVHELPKHTETIRTGKGDLIGYNQHMLSIAMRGDSALPLLEDYVCSARSTKARYAGILTVNLIGITCETGERFREKFHSRAAREVFWRLLKTEGLTDEVARMLKRDPWPEDIPVIMDALAKVEGDCPATLSALIRYAVPGCPLDFLPPTEGERPASFKTLAKDSECNAIRNAMNGLRASGYEVHISKDAFSAFSDDERKPTQREPENWSGTVHDLLVQVKKESMFPSFSYCSDGNPVFFVFEPKNGDVPAPSVVRFLGPGSARVRLLQWWHDEGRKRYLSSLPVK